jgi:hypothetical protein
MGLLQRNPPFTDDKEVGYAFLSSSYELICPTGCLVTGLSSPILKNISVPA